jgi:hypothetical protein
MATSDEKPQGFTVNDRRAAAASEPGGPASASGDRPTGGGAASLPPVEFHTFLLSLGSSALMHLGEIESPDSGQPRKNLALAKHTIDVLAMLQDKTKGNVTPAEEQLLESLLFDLRLRYVEAAKRA